MWLPIFGLIIGIVCGSLFTFAVPPVYAQYLSVAVLAALDSLIGGWRAILEDKFDGPILMTGFFTNALLAAGLAYLGDLLGLDIYLAAVIAFGLRIFSNIGVIRRHLIMRYRQKTALALLEKNQFNDENTDSKEE
ncbi:MAG: small basic family protein [Bacillota bacterium]|jgi:small basic protein